MAVEAHQDCGFLPNLMHLCSLYHHYLCCIQDSVILVTQRRLFIMGSIGGIEDIEDIIGNEDVTPQERYNSRKLVVPKTKKIRQQQSDVNGSGDSIIPGTQKVYVKTWGCSHNNSDGEYMAGQLSAYGYKIVGKLNHGEFPGLILLVCSNTNWSVAPPLQIQLIGYDNIYLNPACIRWLRYEKLSLASFAPWQIKRMMPTCGFSTAAL